MGVDFATLGIELDSRPVAEGTKALDALAETSVRVEQKVGAMNGQMNDTAAIMRKNAEASNTASQAVQQFLAPLQREIDLFGANRAETERYNAAKAGLAAAAQRQAAALGANIDALRRDEQAARDFVAMQDMATRAGERFVQNLKDQVAVLGMNSQQLHAYRAAQLGVSEAATPLIAKLAEAGTGAHTASSHIDGLSFASVGAKRELLVLAHELSQGNYQKFGGSMMVLGEQTGAAGLLFSAAGLAALGLAAAVGGVAFAMIKGSLDQKHMNDALVMTGNYAGLTSDSLNNLAHAAVAAGGSIGEAKKVATELAGSGKFTGDQIGYITEATVAWEHATGQSVKSIIKDFESLAVQTTGNNMRATEAISRATIKLDDQYHFLTESIYEQIRALEKEGDAKGASALATETFAKATHERAEEIIHNLGNIARAWNGVKEAVGGAVDAAGNWGKKATPASEVDRLTKALAQPNMLPGVYNAETRSAAVALATQQRTQAQNELNAANAAATAQGKATLTQSEAVHAASRIAADDVKLQKRGMGELQLALSQYADDIAKVKAANPASALVTDEAVAAGIAARTKAHTAQVKGNDDRHKILQDALILEQTAFDREKSIYDLRDKMLGLYHSKFGASDADFYAGRENARAEYIAAEAIAYAKEASLIDGFKPKNAEEVAAKKTKLDTLTRQHLEFNDKMNAARVEDQVNELAAQRAVQSASDDANNKYLSDLSDRAKAIDIANGKHEKAASAVADHAAQQFRLASGLMAVQAAAPITGDHTQADADAAKSMLTTLLLQADAQERIAAALRNGEAAAASRKLADMAIQDWQRAGTSIADSLTKAFGSGGKAIGEMFKAYYDNAAKQGRLDKEMALAKVKLDSDPTKLKEIDNIQRQSAQAQLKSYADMAGAAQGFFSEGSRGYQAMAAAAKVMHAAEVALSLVKGVNAVLTQGGGDPYSAFARMAAMAAIVTGLGVALSGGGGGGGGQSAADVQKAQGTGSVFGDSTAKSDSIARGIELVSKNSGIELTHTAGMLASLRNIEASMTGLTNLVVRTTGVTDGSNMGIQTGTLSQGPGGFMGTVTNALSQIPLFGSPLGTLAKLWGNTKQNVVDSGLQFGGKVSDLQAGRGYSQYASVDTTKSSWFGLSKSTSNSVQTQGLGNELSSQFGLIFTNLEKSLKLAATGIGIGTDQVTKALDGLTIDTTKISLKGLTGDALTSALNSVISKTMDQMAEAAFPSFENLRKVGEGYAETVVRVAANYANLDSILAATSMTFGATGLSSLRLREDFIDLAGGIDNLASKSTAFATNFMTEAERLAPVSKYVAEQLAAMGLAGVDTRVAFKDVVLGLDLTSVAGQQQYVGLLKLADAFALTHAATEDLTKSTQAIADERRNLQNQLDDLTMSSTELLKKQRDALDATNKGLFDQVQTARAAKDAADALATTNKDYQGQIDQILRSGMSLAQVRALDIVGMDASTIALYDRLAGLKKEAEATKLATEAIQKAQEAARASWSNLGSTFASITENARTTAQELRAFSDSLLLGGLSSLSPEQKYIEAQRQLDTATAPNLQSAASAFLQASKEWFGSSAGFAQDFAKTQAMIRGTAASKDDFAASLPSIWRAISGGFGMDGSHAGGLDRVPFNGYRAITHRDEAILSAPDAKRWRSGGDDSASKETNSLLRTLIDEARADKVQRGAVSEATLDKLEKLAEKTDATKRQLARA